MSIFYNGKNILPEHFRAFVYDANGGKVLCKNYLEYKKLVGSGVWFDKKPEPEKEPEKEKEVKAEEPKQKQKGKKSKK